MEKILQMYTKYSSLAFWLNKKLLDYEKGDFSMFGPFCLLLDYSVCHYKK